MDSNVSAIGPMAGALLQEIEREVLGWPSVSKDPDGRNVPVPVECKGT